VQVCLFNIDNLFHYFFEDYFYKVSAPTFFRVQMLANLKTQFYKHDEVVVERNSKMTDFLLIAEGACNLVGFYESEIGREHSVNLLKLPTKSWYGETLILLNIQNSLELRATTEDIKRNKKGANTRFSSYVKIFKLPADMLVALTDEYPEFGKFLILRATKRRAHFLQVLETRQKQAELRRKISQYQGETDRFNGLEEGREFAEQSSDLPEKKEPKLEELLNEHILQQAEQLIKDR